MFIKVPEKTCSACGSRDNETFIDNVKSGIRCKNCGHEDVKYHHRHETSSTGWSKDNTKIETF